MPLRKEHSRAAVSYNIKELVASGRPRNQAIAIALSVTGYSDRQKKKKKKEKGHGSR